MSRRSVPAKLFGEQRRRIANMRAAGADPATIEKAVRAALDGCRHLTAETADDLWFRLECYLDGDPETEARKGDPRRGENRRVNRLLARAQTRRVRSLREKDAPSEYIAFVELLYRLEKKNRARRGGSSRVRRLYGDGRDRRRGVA